MSAGNKRQDRDVTDESMERFYMASSNYRSAVNSLQCMELLYANVLSKDLKNIVLDYLIINIRTMSNHSISYLLPDKDETAEEFKATDWYIIGHIRRGTIFKCSARMQLTTEARLAMRSLMSDTFLISKAGSTRVAEFVRWVDVLENHQELIPQALEWMDIALDTECVDHSDGDCCGGRLYPLTKYHHRYSHTSEIRSLLFVNMQIISSSDRKYNIASRRMLKADLIGCGAYQ